MNLTRRGFLSSISAVVAFAAVPAAATSLINSEYEVLIDKINLLAKSADDIVDYLAIKKDILPPHDPIYLEKLSNFFKVALTFKSPVSKKGNLNEDELHVIQKWKNDKVSDGFREIPPTVTETMIPFLAICYLVRDHQIPVMLNNDHARAFMENYRPLFLAV